jgi:hypothetical protein
MSGLATPGEGARDRPLPSTNADLSSPMCSGTTPPSLWVRLARTEQRSMFNCTRIAPRQGVRESAEGHQVSPGSA